MVWNGVDISNHQGGIDMDALCAENDFIIAKATEGTTFVDPWCDTFVQAAKAHYKAWGFYHFARRNDPIAEADFFIDNTINYFGEGIPVLDWEDDQDVSWVNSFVQRVHDRTQVWPWIYANPWRFQQGGVNANCGRWVASYPGGTPSPDACPAADGITVCAWQYTSTPLDKDYFYGDSNAWAAYAKGDKEIEDMTPEQNDTLNAIYNEVTRRDDPSGREVLSTTHEHVKWIAAAINGDGGLSEVIAKLVEVTEANSEQIQNIAETLKSMQK